MQILQKDLVEMHAYAAEERVKVRSKRILVDLAYFGFEASDAVEYPDEALHRFYQVCLPSVVVQMMSFHLSEYPSQPALWRPYGQHLQPVLFLALAFHRTF